MARNKFVLAGVGVAAVAALALGGNALANAATSDSTSTPSASSSSSTSGQGKVRGQGGMGHSHTAVTGDELAKVKAAVTAKDSTITVNGVMKDADGTYDVHGTKAGAPVMLDVSADLKTITENAGRMGGGPGGMGKGGMGGGMGQDTPVTGDELAKVTAAVTAKDSAVKVERVQMDPDKSYDVFGTKAGAPVMFEVSADLKTITENAGRPGMGQGGRPGGGMGHHGMGGEMGQGGQMPGRAPSGSGSSTGAPTVAPTPSA